MPASATFMSAYMDLNDIPATGNRWLLHDVLRDTWNYKGFVVSDANAVHSLITHGYARDGQDATYKAFSAGLNMDMASGTYLKYLADEVKQNRISMQQIDDAVLPILEAKIRLGLFEHPYIDEARIHEVLNRSRASGGGPYARSNARSSCCAMNKTCSRSISRKSSRSP